MQKDFEKEFHQLEKNHWLFSSKRDIIKKIIKKFPKKSKILDIGCSSGILIMELKKIGYKNIIGIDKSKRAVKLCKKNKIKSVFLMDGENPNFKKSRFDIIIASDVIEHIKKDTEAIKNWKKILKKKGEVICFAPALKILWSDHDFINQHYRRYTKNRLEKMFKKEKFKVLRSSYWNFFLFFPLLFFRILKKSIKTKHFQKRELFKSNELVNFSLKSLLKVENNFLRFINLPIGISILIIAEKR